MYFQSLNLSLLTRGPDNGINAFVIQELPTHSAHMRLGLVLHQEEPMAYCASVNLTITLRISSQYLTAVRVLFAMTWRSMQPSKEMPPQTITDPPPNQSCWMMSRAVLPSPWHLQTLSCLSHVQWRTCQFWCPTQMPVELHGAGLWAQVQLEHVGPSCHPRGVGFWQFDQKYANQYSLSPFELCIFSGPYHPCPS